MRLSAVIACAARAQSSNARSNSSDCQSPVITENGSAGAHQRVGLVLGAVDPLVVREVGHVPLGVTLRSGWMFASSSGTGELEQRAHACASRARR